MSYLRIVGESLTVYWSRVEDSVIREAFWKIILNS